MTPFLSSLCNTIEVILYVMKTKGITIFNEIRRASVIILAIFVVLLISSCSPETMQLCRVGISTENSTRNLTATIITDPLANYNIYYKCLYKGTGKSYCGITNENEYRLLDSNGILLSQGLWEIKVIFKSKNVGTTYSPTDLTTEITGTTGDTYINLNTKKLTVTVDTSNSNIKGSISIEYSLKKIPATSLSENPLSLDIYKYDNGSFIKINTSVSLTNNSYVFTGSLDIDPGIYFAVFSVTGTVNRNTGIISVDSIGFVVRSSLKTLIKGECEKYYVPVSNSNIVIVKPDSNTSGTGNPNASTDIKDFQNSQFTNNTIYQIDNSSNSSTYYLFPTNDTFVKTLDNNTNITIDTNGVNIVNTNSGNNAEKDGRTYFVLNSSTSLTLLNSKEGTKTIYGCSDSKIKSQYQTNFRLNGGTLTVGTYEKQGQLNLKGCSADAKIQNGNVRHPAIEFTPSGGTVNLIGGNNTTTEGKKLIQIEDSVIGIGTDPTISSDSTSGEMNISINVNNTYINAQGADDMNAYGIYINGFHKSGSITINIENKAIVRSSKTKEAGCGIYIKDFNGSITINVLGESEVKSGGNYGIHIDNCNVGSINITKSSNSDIDRPVFINGVPKTFSTDGKISISAKN